jgi:hypothetical protein
MHMTIFALMAALLATTAAPPQLLVRDSNASGECRQAPGGWRAREPIPEATPAAVAEDLRRYFKGFSVQGTAFIHAAWYGHVRFCTSGAEADVARVLAHLVVKPLNSSREGVAQLPIGAKSLLTALASKVLEDEVAAITVTNSDEEARKRQALTIVRANLVVSQVHEDVVAALDTDLVDKVIVYFREHAAVYFLIRDDPDFGNRLERLQGSLAHARRVRFTYAVAGQVLRSVECAEPTCR